VLPPQSVSLAELSPQRLLAVATFPTRPTPRGSTLLATLIGSGGSGSYSWQVAAGSVASALVSRQRVALPDGRSSVAVGNHSFRCSSRTPLRTHYRKLTLRLRSLPTQANCTTWNIQTRPLQCSTHRSWYGHLHGEEGGSIRWKQCAATGQMLAG